MVTRFNLVDIRLVWDSIKPAIEQLREQWGFDWRAEDVYTQCYIGRAFCYTCAEGFIIVKPQENQYSLSKELFVWICYSTANNGLIDYLPDINALAKDIYATRIIFESPREGFRKLAKHNNWRSITNYTLTVT